MSCQPILFVGTGISKRYCNSPSWHELLDIMSKSCPKITKEYAYYQQFYDEPTQISDAFADSFREWAWGDGRKEFDDSLFNPTVPSEIYFKQKIAE
jgi:hypothetical protein